MEEQEALAELEEAIATVSKDLEVAKLSEELLGIGREKVKKQRVLWEMQDSGADKTALRQVINKAKAQGFLEVARTARQRLASSKG